MKKYLGKAVVASLALGAGFFVSKQVSAGTYTVREGDSFYSIAQAFQMDIYELAANNQLGIYDLIVPGQTLEVPSQAQAPAPAAALPATGTTAYTIEYGDSFSSIAQAFNMDYIELASINNLSIYDLLIPGQTLQVSGQVQSEAATEIADSYYLPGYSYEPGINYPIGQCTWGVQKVASWAGDWWGNAADWGANAARDGFRTGSTPEVGAIISWNDGGLGHVAYVIAVESETRIQVLEANYRGQQWVDNFRGWFNPIDSVSQITYIYPN